MKNKILFLFLVAFSITACEKALIPSLETTPQAIFEELWQHVDENYIYFDLKQVDWLEQYNKYAPLINNNLSDEELYDICLDMLNELRDGHNRLRSRVASKRYLFETGYDIVFDKKVVQQNYLNNSFQTEGDFQFGILEDNIGYIYYEDFSSQKGLATVMEYFQNTDVKGLIFDVRGNGGGTEPEKIVPYFIDQPTVVGYTVAKIGKGHQEVSENLSFLVNPATSYFDKPVKLLTNRGSFSATSYFAGMMKYLPNVTIIGQITGGGGGGNAAYRLQNDWVLFVSVNTFLDVEFNDVEPGVVPHIELNNTEAELLNGTDAILERAIADF